ncbi:unnamed protein product [Notodromas monacha]|uniref:Uncharacterized protein n=1 Tax=Notodromas monacha TaxID=399045 RepID=A0A7R9GKR7_9CRUS|nr:unnamed protein product [Notodromas monacha]CAD7285993.1 unnamed protein product [Notodromas monacha]CAG0926127.1 unnamed protein product [Notodromas monacha]CAG0926145.1 unnamed protein product [Notodromas monacha]
MVKQRVVRLEMVPLRKMARWRPMV